MNVNECVCVPVCFCVCVTGHNAETKRLVRGRKEDEPSTFLTATTCSVVPGHAGAGVLHQLRGDLHAGRVAAGQRAHFPRLSARDPLQLHRRLHHPSAGLGRRQVSLFVTGFNVQSTAQGHPGQRTYCKSSISAPNTTCQITKEKFAHTAVHSIVKNHSEIKTIKTTAQCLRFTYSQLTFNTALLSPPRN